MFCCFLFMCALSEQSMPNLAVDALAGIAVAASELY